MDKLNHFDISLKHTAGKGIKFTDFISRNPTENPEPEVNYEGEFLINAIAQIATVNAPIGRIFNQSDGENETNGIDMHDTRSQSDTRRQQTNTSHIDSDYCALQLHSNTYTNNYHSEMDNDQNARYFRVDG